MPKVPFKSLLRGGNGLALVLHARSREGAIHEPEDQFNRVAEHAHLSTKIQSAGASQPRFDVGLPAVAGGLGRPVAFRQWVRFAVISIGILAVAAASSLHAPIASPMADFFHEGEYLAHAGKLGIDPQQFPILIHGWLDLIPAQIAAEVFPEAHLIFGTRLVNALFGGLAVALYLSCTLLAVRPRSVASWLAILPASLFVLMFGMNGASMVGFHQGAPGIRDLALLASLAFCLATLRRSLDETVWRAGWLLMFASGVCAGVGPFWCYDRGITWAPIFIVTCCLLLRRIQTKPAALSGLGGIALTLGMIGAVGPLGGIDGSLNNILYWLRYGSMWSYPLSLWQVKFMVPAAALVVNVLLLVLRLKRTMQAADPA